MRLIMEPIDFSTTTSKIAAVDLNYIELMNTKIDPNKNITLNDIRKCTGTGGGLLGGAARNFNRLIAFSQNKGWITDSKVKALVDGLVNDNQIEQFEKISQRMNNLKNIFEKFEEEKLNDHWDPEKKASTEIKQLREQAGALAKIGKKIGQGTPQDEEVAKHAKNINAAGIAIKESRSVIKSAYEKTRRLEETLATISRADPLVDINETDTPEIHRLFQEYIKKNDPDFVGHINLPNYKRALTDYNAFVKDLPRMIKNDHNFDTKGLEQDAEFLNLNAFRHLPY